MKSINITDDMTKKIVERFPDGDVPFYTQDLEEMNVEDAKSWLDSGSMQGIVSEEEGGIIGYIHEAHAEEIAAALTIHSLHNSRNEGGTVTMSTLHAQDLTRSWVHGVEERILSYAFRHALLHNHNGELEEVIGQIERQLSDLSGPLLMEFSRKVEGFHFGDDELKTSFLKNVQSELDARNVRGE